jgi:GT2 family glycosyltransferase
MKYDIIVPTFNRYRELPVFFERNKALQQTDVHVWIIDDNSPDFDPSVIPQWGNLTLLRLEQNRGQAGARNVAIEKSNAPYIISLDDDAWFENVGESLSCIDEYFSNYQDVGCLMFNIATPNSVYSQMPRGTELALHVTCGCAYRRQVLEQVHGFSGFLHSGAEETDLSMRICKTDFKIRFAREVKVFHNFDAKNRSLEWYLNVRYQTTRNDLLIVLMYYPTQTVPLYVFGKWANHLKFAFSNRQSVFRTSAVTCLAFIDFLRMSAKALKRRSPLSTKQFRHWKKLKRHQS